MLHPEFQPYDLMNPLFRYQDSFFYPPPMFSNPESPYFNDDYELLPTLFSMQDFFPEFDMIDPIFNSPTEESLLLVPSHVSSVEDSCTSPTESPTVALPSQIITIPGENMELDNQSSLVHLLKAYGEAVDNGHEDLLQVIIRCLSDKVGPALGSTSTALERVAFYYFPDSERQKEYLATESRKNFPLIFKAFYEIFPYGRFAHFAANSKILESIPDDVEAVHVVDFDIREGIQWPPLIEAIARMGKRLRLTSITIEDGYDEFEDTKWKLCNYAKDFGLKLNMEEMRIQDLITEMKKRGGGKEEWLVFNCMFGLPHMGRDKSRKIVNEFLYVAHDSLSENSTNGVVGNKGIIILGDGDTCQKFTDYSGFGSFFEECLMHSQAIFESISFNFPEHFVEGRMAIESLFLAPYVSPRGWLKKWEEMKGGYYHFQEGLLGLKECKVSKEILREAKELVKEGTLFGVSIGGRCGNEMILEWKGTSLIKVSTWAN